MFLGANAGDAEEEDEENEEEEEEEQEETGAESGPCLFSILSCRRKACGTGLSLPCRRKKVWGLAGDARRWDRVATTSPRGYLSGGSAMWPLAGSPATRWQTLATGVMTN